MKWLDPPLPRGYSPRKKRRRLTTWRGWPGDVLDGGNARNTTAPPPKRLSTSCATEKGDHSRRKSSWGDWRGGACRPVWQRERGAVASSTLPTSRCPHDGQVRHAPAEVLSHPPNNFASLLLIVGGAVSAPIGIGVVLLITGLALLREANGERSFPRLQGWLNWLQTVQFWRMIRL